MVIADSATSIKKLGMELGGNAPFIVFEDAAIDKALDLAIGIKFGNSGQICVAANRFFVHSSLYDTFFGKNTYERVNKIKLGSWHRPETRYGTYGNTQRTETVCSNLLKLLL